MMSMGLPLIFAPIMIGFPAGLLVYWIATNVWTMGQQGVVKTFFPAAPAKTPDEIREEKPPPPPPRKRKRRR
jgi:YidC/Oxa1 family membrane protein insertase